MVEREAWGRRLAGKLTRRLERRFAGKPTGRLGERLAVKLEKHKNA